MSRFDIVLSDPQAYRDRIIELWNEYLPGTPAARFDWMNQGNPAGSTVWYFAFEQKSRDLAGVISVMPKTMYLNGSPLRVGILGDFMVPKKYRAFGPGLILPRFATEDSLAKGFDCIYTIPNPDSRKIIEKAGMTNEKIIRHFVKPTSLKPYIEQYIPASLAKVIVPCSDLALRIISLESYGIGHGLVREEQDIDAAFDILWETVRSREVGLIGDRSAAYLRWKYLQNPLNAFRLITVCNKMGHNLRGYLFFLIMGGRMEIYDLLVIDQQQYLPLIKKAAQIARATGCQCIYLRINAENTMIPWLSKCWFIDARDDIVMLNRSRISLFSDGWYFMSGDRNI